MCLALRSVKALLAPALALIVIGPLRGVALAGQTPWEEYAHLSCMDGIAFGCLAALLTARGQLSPRVLRSMLAFGTAALALIALTSAALISTPTGEQKPRPAVARRIALKMC
jgi:hypothetical protein